MKRPSVPGRALLYGGILTVAVAVVGGVIGYLVGGGMGLVSALVGAGLAFVFMGLTAVSILIATRVASGLDGIVTYFGIIMGTFLIKIVLFIIFTIWLHTQAWVNGGVFGFTSIAAVIGSLVVDLLAFRLSRVPYTDVALPGESGQQGKVPAKKSLEDS